jgi:hypothetical protein
VITKQGEHFVEKQIEAVRFVPLVAGELQ